MTVGGAFSGGGQAPLIGDYGLSAPVGDLNAPLPTQIPWDVGNNVDPGWSAPGGVLTFTGAPSRVDITLFLDLQAITNAFWNEQQIRVLRGAAQIKRGHVLEVSGPASVNANKSIAIVFTDWTPGVNPDYSVEGVRFGLGTAVVQATIDSQIRLEAHP